ncbi:hypothetical protein IMZ48_37760 [Candidatus Bathyarchaeota archaeon]|nr:hypothetical protein [Candidatus Bathyarchaeota archaeon]
MEDHAIRSTHTSRKVHAGFFGAPELGNGWIMEARARRAYERYCRVVCEAVTLESGRRLDYTPGRG